MLIFMQNSSGQVKCAPGTKSCLGGRLEYVELSAPQELFLANQDGLMPGLKSKGAISARDDGLQLYKEIEPVSPGCKLVESH